MVTITATYEGSLHCSALHGPSGSTLDTDAPRDNEGRGEAFSPTDLVATALATCTLTTMAILARREDIPFEGATAVVEKVMTATPRRRIGALRTRITMPAGLTPPQRTKLENAARHCPVHHSLHPDVEVDLAFDYPEER